MSMGKVYHLYRGGVPQEIKKEGSAVMEVKESAEKEQQTQKEMAILSLAKS
jgi:hypothetical protein